VSDSGRFLRGGGARLAREGLVFVFAVRAIIWFSFNE
jgi:hypothetical protein